MKPEFYTWNPTRPLPGSPLSAWLDYHRSMEAYAERNGLVFLTGQDIVDAWRHPAPQAAAPRRVPTSAS